MVPLKRQDVRAGLYPTYYRRVSTMLLFRNSTQGLREEKMCWYETWFGPSYTLLLIESFMSFLVL